MRVTIRDLIGRLRRIEQKQEDLEIEIGRVADDLEQYWDEHPRQDLPAPLGPRESGTERNREGAKEEQQALNRLAQTGVDTVRIVRLADDSGLVAIEHLPHIHLPPALADLLDVLCVDAGDSSDGFVATWPGWPGG